MTLRIPLLAAALLALAGCSDDGIGNVLPNLVVAPDRLEFGERPVLDDLTLDFDLENLGGADLTVSNVAIVGDDGFSIVGEKPETIQRGSSVKLRVNFVAKEKKAYAAKVVIDSDDPTTPKLELPLSGTGSTAATALIEPRTLDFGRVGESRSAVRRVKITSIGTADLKIRTIKFKPGTSAVYATIGSTQTGALARHVDGVADAFAEVSIRCSPSATALDTTGTLIIETTDPDNALVEIPLTAGVNRQPIAVPGFDRQVAPGTPVELDGSGSSDPDGDVPLTYAWKLVSRPQASATTLTGADQSIAALTPDLPGNYVVELIVTDSAGLASAAARVQVSGVTADKLLIELVWDHALADLDLHVRPEGQAWNGVLDCTGERPHPDWGVVGDPNDDPSHSGDVLSGFGPERVLVEDPANGKYLIGVTYVTPQGAVEQTVRATVRVWLYGVVVREMQRLLLDPGEVWDVASIAWPAGVVATQSGATP